MAVQTIKPAGTRTFTDSYPGTPDQVAQVRAALVSMLNGCPVADDVVLTASELSANAVVHTRSGQPGGRFAVQVTVRPGDYVWIEVEDQGGPWARPEHEEKRHGLDIVEALVGPGNWGVDGNDVSGWTVWARLDWLS
jgi:serine/threonine-protein kinase RsbW